MRNTRQKLLRSIFPFILLILPVLDSSGQDFSKDALLSSIQSPNGSAQIEEWCAAGEPVADVRFGRKNQNALLVAASGGNLKSVQALLDCGLDPNFLDDTKTNALFYARDFPEIIWLLLDRGADPNQVIKFDQPTLFVLANNFVPQETLLYLVNAGADINATWDGMTPLMATAVSGNLSNFKTLMLAGSDSSATLNGQTASMLARGKVKEYLQEK